MSESDENRETILANFQACTGVEDVAEAFTQLEAANWDLMTAVNQSMAQAQAGPDIEMVEQRINGETSVITPTPVSSSSNTELPITIASDFAESPSTSQCKSRARRINFTVTHLDEIVQFSVPENLTVWDVKTLIAGKTGVPVCQQLLAGWANEPQSDADTLTKLKIPHESFLFVSSLNSENNGFNTGSEEEKLKRLYTLNVHDETTKKDYSLKYPGTKLISEIKQDVAAITSIHVRHQVWSGWPSSLTDDSTELGLSGIMYPQHPLSVNRSPDAPPRKECKRIVVDIPSDSSEDFEEFEDASESFTVDDEMFVDDVASKKLQPLLPNNVEDETAGCAHFADEFRNRYGSNHPDFYPSTLDEAIREACFKPAKERKLLAVYLHHEGSVLTNVFCTQLLCFDSVLQFLKDNFIVWGWDLTYESNRNKFLTSVTNSLGTMAAHTIRNMEVERLPALLIIMRMRSNIEIFTVVHGNVGVNELLTSLIQAVDLFSEHQRKEAREEEERNAREMIKTEQDQAYQQSLEMDRAKEEAKKQQELTERLEKERLENERQETEARKQAQRREVEKQLPKEPEEGETVGITKIRFRLPKGESIERKFYTSDKLKALLNFLVVKGFPQEEFKVISSWPRRDLTSLDSEETLQELKLYPQETVILEER
nr:PREDICTED: FAS-associated factor 1 [Bemisia tabaci]